MSQSTNQFFYHGGKATARTLGGQPETATLAFEDPSGNEVTLFADGPDWFDRFRRMAEIFNEASAQPQPVPNAALLDDNVPF